VVGVVERDLDGAPVAVDHDDLVTPRPVGTVLLPNASPIGRRSTGCEHPSSRWIRRSQFPAGRGARIGKTAGMEITKVHTFAHPVSTCWAMFHDPSSHVDKFTAMGHRELQVLEEKQTDSSLRMVIERLVDVDVPGFARKVIKPTNVLRSTDLWEDRGDGTFGGTFDLESRGVPIETRGRTLLEPDGDDRSRYTVTIDLKVKVPLIGGKIADFSKGIIEKQLDEEFRLGDEWLENH
jgi:hypothetical protein